MDWEVLTPQIKAHAGSSGAGGPEYKPPAIIPMRPGSNPTEPGIYAYRVGKNAGLVRLNYGTNFPDGDLIAVEFGTQWSAPMSLLTAFEWIARIYPDRIEQE